MISMGETWYRVLWFRISNSENVVNNFKAFLISIKASLKAVILWCTLWKIQTCQEQSKLYWYQFSRQVSRKLSNMHFSLKVVFLHLTTKSCQRISRNCSFHMSNFQYWYGKFTLIIDWENLKPIYINQSRQNIMWKNLWDSHHNSHAPQTI